MESIPRPERLRYFRRERSAGRVRSGEEPGLEAGASAGTLVAYSQPGDIYRLYEINPVVVDLAAGGGDYFSFLSDSEAEIITVLGDARISLQRELDDGQSQNFDVLVLDTFSSDSIPVHLVTNEAFALYLAHLAPDGIIAAHITNLHLHLAVGRASWFERCQNRLRGRLPRRLCLPLDFVDTRSGVAGNSLYQRAFHRLE